MSFEKLSGGYYLKPFSIRLRSDVRDKLKVIAAAQDRNRNNMIKHLIEAEFNRLEREIGTEGVARIEAEVLGN